jgi:hypothetical protein
MNEISWRAAVIGRWVARVAGTLFALLFLAFFVGEGPPPVWRLTFRENLLFAGMTAICIGLLLAWKWHALGPAVTLAGFLVMQIDPRAGRNILMLLPAATAALHLLCRLRIRRGPPAGPVAWQVPKTVLLAAGSLAGIFVLLCANEMFGQPPLMTARLVPPSDLTGDWFGAVGTEGTAVRIFIQPDAAVTGTVGAAEFHGRIRNDRSWFGNLMNWRNQYWLSGRLSENVQLTRFDTGDELGAGLTRRGAMLNGGFGTRRGPVRLYLARTADFAVWWQAFQAAVAKSDARAVARMAHFPLHWENGPIREIQTEADLASRFDAYFTPEIRKNIAARSPEKLPTGGYSLVWKARGNEYSLDFAPGGSGFVLEGLFEGPA